MLVGLADDEVAVLPVAIVVFLALPDKSVCVAEVVVKAVPFVVIVWFCGLAVLEAPAPDVVFRVIVEAYDS